MTRRLIGPLLVLVFVLGAAALSARLTATNTPDLPSTPYRYANVALPAHFTQPGRNHDNTPLNNPLTDDGATLGRVLFYDTRLSANSATSCASCHVQAHAFADPRPFSKGFDGAFTDRRAMPLVNLAYYQRARFFWDERAGNLEEMVLLPIQNRVEMGQQLERVVETLGRDAVYPVLFARAFGDSQITEQRIGKALAQFVRSIVSYQSRYDEGRARAQSAQDDFDNFTRQENRGKALFMRNCSTCHMKDGNEHFFVPTPANTGLRGQDPAADGGVADATLRAADLGSFKSPSLRNVEVTAPYGHDGRFATLDALIDHYSENTFVDPNLGYMVPVGPLKFTASEKAALIAFLKTLTDRRILTDPKFSNPFANRTMAAERARHLAITAAAMLTVAGAAAAHAPVVLRSALTITAMPPVPLAPRARSLDAMIERLMSFDGNGDHRIAHRELPERMQGVVARGDWNADGALDSLEIGSIVNTVPSERAVRPFRSPPFEGMSGVIRDLKLPPAKHAGAQAIVSAHVASQNFSDQTRRGFYAEMRGLLDGEEYENFVAATTRLSRISPVIK